jgi:hypothetical protein
MKPLAYVAGPYTGEVEANIRLANQVGRELRRLGYATIVPHNTIISALVAPENYEAYLENDFEQVARCDLVVRLPGDSSGADRECALAHQLGIPVVIWTLAPETLKDVAQWRIRMGGPTW